MADHPRLGAQSVFQYLPKVLFAHILEFIREPKRFTLIDLGSVCGTYVKVRQDIPTPLQEGMTFLVGNDINIDIDSTVTFGA
jgi:pSer/pThr/pTyr-binding forkhead associated (FHA) protein